MPLDPQAQVILEAMSAGPPFEPNGDVNEFRAQFAEMSLPSRTRVHREGGGPIHPGSSRRDSDPDLYTRRRRAPPRGRLFPRWRLGDRQHRNP